MKTPPNRTVLLGVIVIGTVYLLLVLVPKNAGLFARWNLLMDGHLACNLVERAGVEEPKEYRNVALRWLVYRRGQCIGYIDRSGYFVYNGPSIEDFTKRVRSMTALSWAQFSALSALLAWCTGNLAARVWARRHRRTGPGEEPSQLPRPP